MIEPIGGDDSEAFPGRHAAPDAEESDQLSAIYQELRSLAESYLRCERADHTLQATALVHEAYVRLASGATPHANDRRHFFRIAARAMRQILVDHARRYRASKRGGGQAAVSLSETSLLFDDCHLELLEIDDALQRLSALSSNQARVVELRYYAGCTIEETAESLGLSTATVERHWRFARAWLRSQFAENR